MKQLAKNLYNSVNKQVAIVKDSYVATTLIGGAVTALYLYGSYHQESRGNRKAMIAMGTYAGITIHNTGKILLEKYQRDNRKAAIMSKELIDELLDIDGNPEKFKAELTARTVETYRDYRVVVWDDYTALQVQIPAALPIAIACLYEHKVIILSQSAYSQDRDILETIFEHEIGHIVLDHEKNHSDPEGLEYEADEYAYHQGKDIVKALRQLRFECIKANFKYGKTINLDMLNRRIAVARTLSL